MLFKIYPGRNAVHSVPPLVLFLEFSWSFSFLLLFCGVFGFVLAWFGLVQEFGCFCLKHGSRMFFDNTEKQICFLCCKFDIILAVPSFRESFYFYLHLSVVLKNWERFFQTDCVCILTSSSAKSSSWACKNRGQWESVENLISPPHFLCLLVIFTKLAFIKAFLLPNSCTITHTFLQGDFLVAGIFSTTLQNSPWEFLPGFWCFCFCLFFPACLGFYSVINVLNF